MSFPLPLSQLRLLALRVLLLGFAYWGAARIGLLLAPKELAISLIWLPAGIATAALYRWGVRYWPVVFLAAAILQESSFNLDWPLAGALVVGQVLGPVVAAALLNRCGFLREFERRRDITLFCAVTALGTLLTALIGVTTLCLAGTAPWSGFFTAGLHWWLGDWMGVLIAGPLLVSLSGRSWQRISGRSMEFLAWFTVSLVIMGTIFFLPARPGVGMLPFIFVPLVLTVWASMRLGVTGASFGVFALALLAAYGTAQGNGPFIQPILHEGVRLLWAYLIVATTFNLMVTGIERSRAVAELDLIASQHHLEELNVALESAAARAELLASQADVAYRAKSAFLANVSHEIRTPLNGVLTMSQLLTEEPLTADQRRYVGTIRECGKSLLRFIDDILDFSRMEAGKLKIGKESFELIKVLEASTRWLEIEAGRKGVALGFEIDPNVPEVVIGDPGRVRQILVNLVHNAVKFTSEGRVAVRVIRERESASAVTLRFEVADTGVGIAREWLGKLFEPYAQVENNPAFPFGGMGLGLSIARQLTELMGGEIGANSIEHGGSTFWFVLTFGRQSTPAEKGTPVVKTQAAIPDPAAPSGGRGRLLLVEDNRINLEIGELILIKHGFCVERAVNGMEALEKLARGRFDLVLMDCSMPEMDGFEATRKIRDGDGPSREVPVIAMTADILFDAKARCLAAGMNDYISKPLRETEMVAVLERWIKPASSRSGEVDGKAVD